MAEQNKPSPDPKFCIPLPGGRVARVPRAVLEQYIDAGNAAHGAAALGEQDDVVAHSLSVDPATGVSDWHTDWELGDCEYTDESGFPQRVHAWHRHPFGTEYTELWEG